MVPERRSKGRVLVLVDVNERSCVTIEQGLEHAGFVIEKKEWLDRYDQVADASIESWKNGILARVNRGTIRLQRFILPLHIMARKRIRSQKMKCREDAERQCSM